MQLMITQVWISSKSIRIISLAVLLASSQYFVFASDLPRHYLLVPLKSAGHKAAAWLSCRIHVPRLLTPKLSFWIHHLWHPPPYSHYKTRKEERRYWHVAGRWKRCLASSDARLGGLAPSAGRHPSNIPLVMSYVPRLLPVYRESVQTDEESKEYKLSPDVYRKWHKMAYPFKRLPSVRHAAQRIKNLSSRDRKEIYRISRMLPDEVVFQDSYVWTSVYKDMWTHWLDTKGPDIAIVFEKTVSESTSY